MSRKWKVGLYKPYTKSDIDFYDVYNATQTVERLIELLEGAFDDLIYIEEITI